MIQSKWLYSTSIELVIYSVGFYAHNCGDKGCPSSRMAGLWEVHL